MGRREELINFISTLKAKYYVYELCWPSGEVFYVGKGTKRRVLEHELEAKRHHPVGETNPFKCNVIRLILRQGGAIQYRIADVFGADEEGECLEFEAKLIKLYGRRHEGGSLTNLAGGIGSMAGAAPHSKAKHAATLSGTPDDNVERAVLNRFLQGIGAVKSVPIKPVSQIKVIRPTTPHPNSRRATPRSAFALVASASANGLSLRPGIRIPRTFEFQGVEGIIENGVSRDLVKAGLAVCKPAADPKDEVFLLDQNQLELLVSLVGFDQLRAIGLI